jgi:hypothetical protein
MLLPAPVFACVCAGTETVSQAYKDSAAVFTGRLIAAEYRKGIKSQFAEIDAEFRGKTREYETLVYRFQVTRWYKGDNSTKEAVIVTEHLRFLDDRTETISDCELGFEKNIDYLIYAYGDKDGLGTGVCSRTKRITRAKPELTQLEKLRSRG